MQVIGSVAAIWGAFAVSRNEARQAEAQRARDQIQQEADLCRTALLISMDAVQCLTGIKGKLNPRYATPKNIGTERIEEILYSLRSLAAKNLTFQIHSEVLVLQRELAYTLTAVRQVNDGGTVNEDRLSKASTRLRTVVEASKNLLALAKNRYQLPEVTLPPSADADSTQ
jgi:hypothetical protein